ncbi:MAG: hypothetical protein ACYDEP_02335 [Acidimicrobiales bacterium]
MCAYKVDLEARGHQVPARWLLGEHQIHGLEAARAVENNGPVPADQAVLFAEDDIEDLLAADVVISFTTQPRSGATRGGRHVEFGVALGVRRSGGTIRRLFIVGPLENVFHALPEVDGVFDDWAGFLGYLDAQPGQHGNGRHTNAVCTDHPWHKSHQLHDWIFGQRQEPIR